MLIKNNKYLVPLGSACYLNAGLGLSMLKDRKIFKTPFNGTRILSNSHFPPIMLFFISLHQFKKSYCNVSNWEIKLDGNDIQAHNNALNIRRCHLKKNNPLDFIHPVENTMNFIIENMNNIQFLLDLNDYLIYDEQTLFKIKEIVDAYNIATFIREHSIFESISSIQKIKSLLKFDLISNVQYVKKKFNLIQIDKVQNDDIMNYTTFFNNYLK